MKYKILGWIAIAWGGLFLVTGIVNVATGRIHSAAFAAGQTVALGFAALMLYAGIRALSMEPGQRRGPHRPFQVRRSRNGRGD